MSNVGDSDPALDGVSRAEVDSEPSGDGLFEAEPEAEAGRLIDGRMDTQCEGECQAR